MKKENKLIYGIKNVYVASITDTGSKFTYGTPVALKGAKSLKFEAQSEKASIYADDIEYYTAYEGDSYNGTLEVLEIPQDVEEVLFETNLDTKKVSFETVGQKSKQFALLFEFTGDQYARRHIFYNCVAKKPNLESATKEKGIKESPISLEISATPNPYNDIIKAKTTKETDETVYNNWFTTVQEKVNG